MSRTTFSGPLRIGRIRYGQYADISYVPATITRTIGFATVNGATATEVLTYIPAASRILDCVVDVTTAFNTLTSAFLTMGKTSGGFEYFGSASTLDMKAAAARTRPTFTATQLGNIASTSSDVTAATVVTATGQAHALSALYMTITQVGTAATAGSVTITVTYVPLDERTAVAAQ